MIFRNMRVHQQNDDIWRLSLRWIIYIKAYAMLTRMKSLKTLKLKPTIKEREILNFPS